MIVSFNINKLDYYWFEILTDAVVPVICRQSSRIRAFVAVADYHKS